MNRNPLVMPGIAPGRLHLSLRTLAANDNLPLEATSPPLHADGGASTRWPILRRAEKRNVFAKLAVLPAPNRGLGVEAGKVGGARP